MDTSEYVPFLCHPILPVLISCLFLRSVAYFPDASSYNTSTAGQRTPSRRASAADHTTYGVDRTPTRTMVSLESTGTSPGLRRGSTLPPSERPSASSSATQRTMTAGYGSTSSTPHTLTALGLGTAGSSKTRPDGALSSPRRISTSHPPLTAFARRSQSPAPLGPTHEPYYSQTQPPTASTPRFRDREAYTHSQAGSPHHDHFLQPMGLHRRQHSNGSALLAPTPGPSSPAGSVFKSLRRQASNIGLSIGKPDAYDDARKDSDTEDDEPAQTINGTRVWYSSYVTIDWLHDAVGHTRLPIPVIPLISPDQRVLAGPPIATRRQTLVAGGHRQQLGQIARLGRRDHHRNLVGCAGLLHHPDRDGIVRPEGRLLLVVVGYSQALLLHAAQSRSRSRRRVWRLGRVGVCQPNVP